MRTRKRRDSRIEHKNDRWTIDDDNRLLSLRAVGRKISAIAIEMQRTSNGIAERLKYLRRKEREEQHPPVWP